jgi:hypothetical protein
VEVDRRWLICSPADFNVVALRHSNRHRRIRNAPLFNLDIENPLLRLASQLAYGCACSEKTCDYTQERSLGPGELPGCGYN